MLQEPQAANVSSCKVKSSGWARLTARDHINFCAHFVFERGFIRDNHKQQI